MQRQGPISCVANETKLPCQQAGTHQISHLNHLKRVHGGSEYGHLVNLALACSAFLMPHEAIINSLDG